MEPSFADEYPWVRTFDGAISKLDVVKSLDMRAFVNLTERDALIPSLPSLPTREPSGQTVSARIPHFPISGQDYARNRPLTYINPEGLCWHRTARMAWGHTWSEIECPAVYLCFPE
jgi:hypothetical protein